MRASALLIAASIALPFIVVVFIAITSNWAPSGDHGTEILQIDEVGTVRNPLLGAWSRWGWNHPGPLLFYLLAPATWIGGNEGALVGTAVLNGVAVAVACLVAWRRGGVTLLALVAGVFLILFFTVGGGRLIDPWNATVILIPLFALGLVCWAVAERDVWFLPVVVVFGSYLAQSHVGIAPVVGVMAITGVALSARAWRHRGAEEPALLGPRRGGPLAASAGLTVLVWSPALIEELRHDPGNLTLLWRFARDPDEPVTGWSTAWKVLQSQLGIPPSWISRLDDHGYDLDPSSPLPALAVLGAALVCGALAARRGHGAAARLTLLALAALAAATYSVARVSGLPYNYLLRPWWPLTALLWVALLWSLLLLLRPSLPRPSGRVLAVLQVAPVAMLGVVAAVRFASVDVPFPQRSAAVRDLGAQIEAQLPSDASLLVRSGDSRGWGSVGSGMFVHLLQQGRDVYVPFDDRLMFDDWHLNDRDHVDAVVLVLGSDEVLLEVPLPNGALPLASHDPLTVQERARHDELWGAIQEGVGDRSILPLRADDPLGRELLVGRGADRVVVDEFAELRRKGSGYEAYFVPRREGITLVGAAS